MNSFRSCVYVSFKTNLAKFVKLCCSFNGCISVKLIFMGKVFYSFENGGNDLLKSIIKTEYFTDSFWLNCSKKCTKRNSWIKITWWDCTNRWQKSLKRDLSSYWRTTDLKHAILYLQLLRNILNEKKAKPTYFGPNVINSILIAFNWNADFPWDKSVSLNAAKNYVDNS